MTVFSLDSIKTRLVRRITTPPEIVYALNRHAFAIVGCFLLGAGILFVQTATDPPVYSGRAILSFTNESLPVGFGGTREAQSWDKSESLYRNRLQTLKLESVLRRLVQKVNPPNVLLQDENPRRAEYGRARGIVSDARARLKALLATLSQPSIIDTGEEARIHQAMASFRRRSVILPNPANSTVELQVLGAERDLVKKELQAWIESFMESLMELSGETRDFFVDSRVRLWKTREDVAREGLESFRKANPEVTKANHDIIFQELTQYQLLRLDLRRQEGLRKDRGTPRVAVPEKPDPNRDSLLARKRELEQQVLESLPFYPEESGQVRALRERIASVEQKLAAIEPPPPPLAPDERDELGEVEAALQSTMSRYLEIGEKLQKLAALEDELKLCERTRKSYELMGMEGMDREELSRSVQVKVLEKPNVSPEPVNGNPYKRVAVGSAAWLVAGILFALFRELLGVKVRFKSDIVGEFGVPVVGVIPRK